MTERDGHMNKHRLYITIYARYYNRDIIYIYWKRKRFKIRAFTHQGFAIFHEILRLIFIIFLSQSKSLTMWHSLFFECRNQQISDLVMVTPQVVFYTAFLILRCIEICEVCKIMLFFSLNVFCKTRK